ncbi:unnamed protein product, partial [Coregonus sp. 'balchen']
SICLLSVRACVGARDPYCGWDLVLRKCTTLEESVSMSQWEQSITKCPVRNVTVDGGFGPWSGWGGCSNTDGGSAGSCLCRTRACENPTPQCGGQSCHGLNAEVANCSRNGALTPWTLWAPCSTSCGIGFQVRQRSCSNPTPRHGGRVCVGQNREERYGTHTHTHTHTHTYIHTHVLTHTAINPHQISSHSPPVGVSVTEVLSPSSNQSYILM